MSLGRNENFKLVSGSPINYSSATLKSYRYQYIDFAKTEIIVTEGLKVNSDGSIGDVHKQDIRNIMLGKTAIIRMHQMSEMITSEEEEDKDENESPFDSGFDFNNDKYMNLPCGIQTSQGSIITLPLIPDKVSDVENGINVGSEGRGKWIWNVVSAKAPTTARVYGYKTPQHYITNVNCRVQGAQADDFSDVPAIQERKYQLPGINGSFIFCYDIGESSPKQTGRTAIEQKTEPQLFVEVGMSGSSNNSNLKIRIPPSGQITAILKGGSASGGMSVPQTDFLPPQCDKTAGYPTRPLFVYPTYGGVVITNSVNKNMTDGGNEIFVKSNKNASPLQGLQFDNTVVDDDIQNFINDEKGEQGSIFKWIPAVHQESQTKDSLRVKVNGQKCVFQGNITITWTKCLGNFAFCPLYFYNKLYFDLFFKGGFKESGSGNATYTYNVFPVCATNGKKSTDNNGAKPLQVTHFYNDNKLKQAIYHAAVEYEGDSESRYPIEMFGAVVALTIEGNTFDIANGNGIFSFNNNVIDTNIVSGNATTTPSWFELITNCQITCGLQGPTGSLTIDAYPLTDSMNQKQFSYNVGEIDLNIQVGTGPAQMLFKGIGLQMSKSLSDNNYQYTINLVGMQQKIDDMKLVCAPFWDGDKLQAICLYFQNYLNVPLNMVSYEVSPSDSETVVVDKVIPNALPVDGNAETTGTWLSNTQTLIDTGYKSIYFRVPRSTEWESPAIDFPTGTSCLQALKTLANKTSCYFTVGLDGHCYFYELNLNGIPYYCQDSKGTFITTGVKFELNQLISFSLQPSLENKVNAVATFGFLQKRFSNGKVNTSNIKGSTMPGSYYTKLTTAQQGSITIPWTKAMVYVQQGFLTKTELLASHVNRLKFGIASIFQGSVTVLGNTKINHIYQTITIGETQFFVINIQHQIDVSSKTWTTTYGIQRFTSHDNIDF